MKTTPSKFKPLNLVTNDEGKIVIVMGNIQATPIEFNSEEEATKYLEEQPYEMMLNLMMIYTFYARANEPFSTKDNENK